MPSLFADSQRILTYLAPCRTGPSFGFFAAPIWVFLVNIETECPLATQGGHEKADDRPYPGHPPRTSDYFDRVEVTPLAALRCTYVRSNFVAALRAMPPSTGRMAQFFAHCCSISLRADCRGRIPPSPYRSYGSARCSHWCGPSREARAHIRTGPFRPYSA